MQRYFLLLVLSVNLSAYDQRIEQSAEILHKLNLQIKDKQETVDRRSSLPVQVSPCAIPAGALLCFAHDNFYKASGVTLLLVGIIGCINNYYLLPKNKDELSKLERERDKLKMALSTSIATNKSSL